MTADQITGVAIIAGMFCLFAWNRWRHDVVAVVALVALVIADQILGGESSGLVKDPKKVLAGFGNPAVITVAAVLVISRALRNSGVVDLIARRVTPFTQSPVAHITSLSLVVMVLSAFMNNVGALALMLPVALKTAEDRERSPTILLMPMAFASILGGMMTLIGTPPNIIIASLRAELTGQSPFGLFAFSWVGGLVALAGLGFVALAGWRLIPKSAHKKPGTESLFQINEYITEIRVPDKNQWIGQTVGALDDALGENITLFGFVRDGGKVVMPNTQSTIREGNHFVVQADPVDLQEALELHGLLLCVEIRRRIDNLEGEDTGFAEAVMTPNSPLEGRSRTFLRRRVGNHVALVAVARQDKPIRKRLKDVVFRVGDVLLLRGDIQTLQEQIAALSLLPLAERKVSVGVFPKAGLATLIFGVAIALSAFGWVPITIAFVGAVLAYVFAGILPARDIYRDIDWPIIVLLGALIPVSDALRTTGCTQLIAELITGLAGDRPHHWALLASLMVLTMCLSDIINNAATVFIMAPIAVGIAGSLGLNPDPFLMCVAVGASCAFLTPIGHQCNAMILGPGGYRFGDYWKVGLPLEIIIVAVGVPLIQLFWPLSG